MRHSSTRLASWRGVLLLALLLAPARPLTAGSGLKLSLPATGKPARGLLLSVDADWAEGSGYRPVKFLVTCTPPSAADRSLTVRLTMGDWTPNELVTSFELDIPGGSSSVSKVVSLPHYAASPQVKLEVFEDGDEIEEFTSNTVIGTGSGMFSYGWQDVPSVLFVSPTQVDISEFRFLTRDVGSYNPDAPVNITSTSQIACFDCQPAMNLVENWINYSGLDIIFISLSDIRSLASGQPKIWDALRRWTEVGGNLCVYGVGDEWEGLAPLDELLKSSVDCEDADASLRCWKEPDKGDIHSPALAIARASNFRTPVRDATTEAAKVEEEALKSARTKLASAQESPFLWRDLMLGRVVAIANANPFPGEQTQWEWIFNTLEHTRWKWQARHGMTLAEMNPDFDDWLIPEIGVPPIRSYRVLITLFVVAIGPLNYWLLRRGRRLHLLLFTVPLAALITSAALVAYAVLGDGFQTRLRARSFTQIDQRSHEAATWARLSYYAGLAPSRGMLFADDTAVLPLKKEGNWDMNNGKKRSLNWVPEQHLARGWLDSRTPTQFLTLRAGADRHELRVTEDGGACAVDNRLEATVQHLLLCDSEGRLHAGTDIAPDRSHRLESLDDAELRESTVAKIGNILTGNPTRKPMDVYVGRNLRTNRRWYGIQSNYTPSTSESRLEVSLREASTRILMKELKPRTYIAVVDHPAEVATGLQSVVETNSLHVIAGQW